MLCQIYCPVLSVPRVHEKSSLTMKSVSIMPPTVQSQVSQLFDEKVLVPNGTCKNEAEAHGAKSPRTQIQKRLFQAEYNTY